MATSPGSAWGRWARRSGRPGAPASAGTASAAGREQVLRRGGQQLVIGADRFLQRGLDPVEPRPDVRFERGVGRFETGDDSTTHVRTFPTSGGLAA